MVNTFYSASEENTEKIASEIAQSVSKNDYIAFFGEMGSGKTAFMRGFVSVLVPESRVQSPTYAIVNVYKNKDFTINHFDMYRITSYDDLVSTGYFDIIEDGITCVEWSENITEYLPEHFLKISFEKIGSTTRKIYVERQ